MQNNLTPRHRKILELLADGNTLIEVTELLGCSNVISVKNSLTEAKRRLNARSTIQAVVIYLKLKSPPES